MFSGLIKSTTRIREINGHGNEFHLTIDIPNQWSTPLEIGQSIAINGVCLTVEHFNDYTITFFVMQQTIDKTNFGVLKLGDIVNIEPPLRMDEYLNGHLVLGHVDGTVKKIGSKKRGDSVQIEFEKPDWLGKFLYERSSIAINGVSLTVSHVWDDKFAVNIIPVTQEKTNLGVWNGRFNIEIDHFSKMIEKLFELRK